MLNTDFFNDQDFLLPTTPLFSQELSTWDSSYDSLAFSSSFAPSGESLSDFPPLPAHSPALVRSGSSKRQAEPEEGEDVKRKRLARKAELAREGRKRKKERIAELEKQLADMQLELDREKMRSQAALSATGARARAAAIGSVPQATLLAGSANSQKYTVNNLQSLHPCLFVRFLQWILNQNNDFYCDPTSLWFSLFLQEVRVSADQFDQLFNLHQDCVEMSLSSLGSDVFEPAPDPLRQSLHQSTQLLQSFMHILTPPQLIVFFQWVERYGDVCLKINP